MMDEPLNPISLPIYDLNKLIDEWAISIGRFLIAFSSCEYWTYLYIQTFGSKKLHDEVIPINLIPRAKLARAVVSDIGLIKAAQDRVDTAFNRLKKLSKTRNLVAHNAPMFHPHRNTTTGEVVLRHELRSAQDPSKDITIALLKNLQAEANELDEELALLYGLVRQPENRIVRK